MPRFPQRLAAAVIGLLLALPLAATAPPTASAAAARSGHEPFDVVLRGGTVLDGSGDDRYQADVGVRDGFIAAVGDLSGATAAQEYDASGLFVAPGFVNTHSHGSPEVMATAKNMLTQGVTIEIVNPDGGGPADIVPQLADLEQRDLAVNVGAHIGFDSVWGEVVGDDDRRPTDGEFAQMRQLVSDGMEAGGWAVSSKLESVPGFFAQTEEVTRVVEAARPYRTAYQTHIRNEFGDVVDATAEAIQIGEDAGLAPIITHMKVGGPDNWGTSTETLGMLAAARARGTYAASDQYPYIAGQCSLTLFVPEWVQDGGTDAMLARFADPELRPQIREEIAVKIEETVGCSTNAFLPARGTTVAEAAEEMDVEPAEAIMRLHEELQGRVRLIYFYGSDEDLVRILQEPTNAVSCDCGSTVSETTHPRNYGAFAKVLGRFVREQGLLTWEDAIRKMTGLPATQMGMVRRGFLAPGMVADIAVFDPDTVIDHATYEEPMQYAEGMEYVFVNGRLALEDGEPTGIQAGEVVRRTTHMVTRPMSVDSDVSASASGVATVTGADGRVLRVSFSVGQDGGPSTAEGHFSLRDTRRRERLHAVDIGQVQATDGWASFTGVAATASGDHVPILVTVEEADPFHPDGRPTVTVQVGDDEPVTGALSPYRGADVDID